MIADETKFFIAHAGDWRNGGVVYGYGHSEERALQDAYKGIGKNPPSEGDPSGLEELEVTEVPEPAWRCLRETGYPPLGS